MDQYQVIINCRSKELIRPGLLDSLRKQTLSHNLVILESTKCPRRLSIVQDDQKIYFFFDEDVELPYDQYLEDIARLFQLHPDVHFLSGLYKSVSTASYFTKCYNSLIQNWMMLDPQEKGLQKCENAPGGAWIVLGKLSPLLKAFQEPSSWAGEDTYSLRWLQSRGVLTYYISAADVYHSPRSEFLHFLSRAFRQGWARQLLNLKSKKRTLNKSFVKSNISHWPGWLLHQICVELGSLYCLILSTTARKTPKTSPSP